jgi:hypothetical protein
MPQLETGSRATSPIPTFAATVTRTSDIPSMPITAATEGVVVVDYVPSASPTSFSRIVGMVSLEDGPVLHIGTTQRVTSFDGATQVDTANAGTAGAINRAASAWGASSRSIALNGGAVVSGAHDGSMSTATALVLGNDPSGGVSSSVLIARFRFATRRPPDERIRSLSL